MLKNLTVSTILLCLAGSGQASENLVLIETSEGNITIELISIRLLLLRKFY